MVSPNISSHLAHCTEKYSHYIASVDLNYNFTFENHENTLQGSTVYFVFPLLPRVWFAWKQTTTRHAARPSWTGTGCWPRPAASITERAVTNTVSCSTSASWRRVPCTARRNRSDRCAGKSPMNLCCQNSAWQVEWGQLLTALHNASSIKVTALLFRPLF